MRACTDLGGMQAREILGFGLVQSGRICVSQARAREGSCMAAPAVPHPPPRLGPSLPTRPVGAVVTGGPRRAHPPGLGRFILRAPVTRCRARPLVVISF